jgi:glutathione synthase
MVSASQGVKKIVKKKDAARKTDPSNSDNSNQHLEAVAYCTADRYDMTATKTILKKDYTLCHVPEVLDAVVVDVTSLNSRVFVFEAGSIVFWNMDPNERRNFMDRMAICLPMKRNDLDSDGVENESMDYRIEPEAKKSRIGSKGDIILTESQDPLDQYAISNAMSLSVKLATYESNLDTFAESVQYVAESMAAGEKLTLTRRQVFQKIGQLFKLRHDINLGADLLDAPDFYWDREELEVLFRNTCGSLSISKRTKLLNEKLSYCYELMELLTSHLNEEHNTKLEWMIIWLIAIEVGFEVIHFADKFYSH